MCQIATSTIARLIYAPRTAPDFAGLVEWLMRALEDFDSVNQNFLNDGQGMAIFDLDHCRIALAVSPAGPAGRQPNDPCIPVLVVTVGPNGKSCADDSGPFHPQALCSALVERILAMSGARCAIWSETPAPLTPARIREFLPHIDLPPAHHLGHHEGLRSGVKHTITRR